jgi:hypothetical protein
VSAAFENHRNALPATDAHGDQRILAADTLQFVDRFRRDESARAADRVAEGDCPTIRVGFHRVEAEPLVDRNGLRGKGFVGLDDVHLIERQAGLLEHELWSPGSDLRP